MGAGSGRMQPLRRGARLIGLDPVLPAEALDPAGGVHQLLLPREERMAVRADLDVHGLFHRGARFDHVAAHADDARVVVAGMYVLLHRFAPLPRWDRGAFGFWSDYVFIIDRNFLFVLVWFIFPIRNSIASIGFSSFRNLRRIQTLFSSSCVMSSSSFRVPERLMSTAGKTRLSASLRSRI